MRATISLVATFAVASLSALAQSNPAVRTLSLQECIQMALKQNVDLEIERYNPQIARFDLSRAYGGYDPSFSFSGEHSHTESGPTLLGTNIINGAISDGNSFSSGLSGSSPWGMSYSLQGQASDTDRSIGPSEISNSGGSASATVTQSLLKNFWIDGTRLSIRLNKNYVKQSDLDLKQTIMETLTELEQNYYDLIYNRENVVVQQKAVELADQLVAENRKRVEVGAMAPLEAKQAEAQAASARADLISAKSDLAVQENKVKQLITANYSEWAGVSFVPTGDLTALAQPFNLQASWSKALSQHPELLKTKLDLENAGIQLKYDRNQLFPQLDVFGTYGYNGSGNEFSGSLYDIQERNRPFYSFGGQISIPLANISARSRYKSSKATLQQQVLRVKQQERDIMKAVDDDIKTAQASLERVAATRAAREYAEDALLAEQKKLEQGKVTSYTVLQMQRDLTRARGEEIRALDDYNKNLSQLSLDEGATLERLNIDFQAK
jgi:outer membrane protein TolC